MIGSTFYDILVIIFTLFVLVLFYFLWTYKYWERRNLPYLQPKIPFGNTINPLTRSVTIGEIIKGLHDRLKEKGHKHGGVYIFLQPIYMPVHPDLIKNVLVKNFQHFTDRGMYYNEKDDPLSANLFTIGGSKWKNLRGKLTPTFTSGKMKMMFETLLQCTDQLIYALDNYSVESKPIDIKDVLGCFTTDVIGSCAFGIECNSFKDDGNSEFRKHGKNVFAVSKLRALRNTIAFSFPNVSRALGVKSLRPEEAEFFLNVVKQTVEYREHNNYIRNDFMQLLIDLKKESGKEGQETLTFEEIAAQAFVFFIAGFETSSTTMTFCLYELSINEDIQRKVRAEINSVLERYDGKITYEAITDMKYMGQVIDETLRKYPPGPLISRMCTKDYKVEDTDVVIEKETRILISVLGLHHDPEYFPRPETFDPDRFSDENKPKIRPYTYLPFGEGPRICIGLRFGIMQSKVGLVTLLKDYHFTLNNKTVTPLKMETHNIVMSTEGGIWLNATKIEQL